MFPLVGIVLILGYAFSHAWTPGASAESMHSLWSARVRGDGAALYNLGRRLDRGGTISLAGLQAETSGTPGALLALGFEPASGQSGIAAEWAYQSAAGAGHGAAMLRVAEILARARPPRPVAVMSYLRRAAEAGEPRAMWLYAGRLRVGEGAASDPAEALVWARRGAAAGDMGAQYLLAGWLELGHGESVPQDLEEAFANYRAAARQGHPRAGQDVSRMRDRYPRLGRER